MVMSETVSILSKEETMDILGATDSALRHARSHALQIEIGADPSRRLLENIERARLSVEAARSAKASALSIKGHAANAAARLRSAFQILENMPIGSTEQSAVRRAVARGMALLNPLTLDKGPYILIPRKDIRSRRRRSVSRMSRRNRPRFDVTIGELSETNFYAGLDKSIQNGGLFISTYNLYPVGTVINLTAVLPDDRYIIGSATVQWLREHNELAPELPPGMGVVLNNLTPRAAVEIDRYMERNEPILFEAV